MQLWFCLGTAAELIKIYPLIDLAQKKGLEWWVVSTGQSHENFMIQYKDFELSPSRLVFFFDTGNDLSKASSAIRWFSKAYFIKIKTLEAKILQTSKTLPTENDFWFVHGDTLSTYVAAKVGNQLKVPVVHVEAGMRSGNWLHPFPEEISRKKVSRLAQYHMAPSQTAVENLKKENIQKNVFNTFQNTMYDAAVLLSNKHDSPKKPYALVNLHRFENLNHTRRWNQLIETTIEASLKYPTYFVQHPQTEEKLKRDSQALARLKQSNIKLLTRLPFSEFMPLLKNCELLITDGGSNQEESSYFGIPCLILRSFTEREEGLGQNCVLSKFDENIISQFLSNPDSYRRPSLKITKSPSSIIMSHLGVIN